MKLNRLLITIFIFNFCLNQGLSINTGSNVNNQINGINTKFNLNQSFGLLVSNLNGVSTSNAIFGNKLNYNLTNKINLESNLYFISPMLKNYNNPNNLNVKYDLLLNYKISENFQLKIKMTNMKYNNDFNSMKHSILMNE